MILLLFPSILWYFVPKDQADNVHKILRIHRLKRFAILEKYQCMLEEIFNDQSLRNIKIRGINFISVIGLFCGRHRILPELCMDSMGGGEDVVSIETSSL